MPTDKHSHQSRNADKVKVGNPHYEPKKGPPSNPGGGIASFSAPASKKRVIIPIRDKFASEEDLMNFTSILGSLPVEAAKATRFSAKAGRSTSAAKWTLLTDVSVETTEEFEAVVKNVISHSSFRIRNPA